MNAEFKKKRKMKRLSFVVDFFFTEATISVASMEAIPPGWCLFKAIQ